MTRRILSAILAAMITASAAAACGDSSASAPASTTAPSDGSPAETEPAETAPPDYLIHDGVEETDLGGYTFTEIGPFTPDISSFYENGLYAEELNGDAINDIVYRRNHDIMDRFNCNIELINKSGNDLQPLVTKTVKAGEDAYQLVVYGQSTLGAWGLDGIVYDWNTLETPQFDKPWWDKKVNDGSEIGGHLYFVYGSTLLNFKISLYMTIMNGKVARDYGIAASDLYKAVNDGTWTLDQFYSLATQVKEDSDGNGVYDQYDLWGFGGESYNAYTYCIGAGADFLKEEDGVFTQQLDTQKNADICMKVLEMYTNKDACMICENIPNTDNVWGARDTMMKTDRMLFFVGAMRPWLREMESDYSILPNPKYNEAQERYYHLTSCYNGPVACMPVSVADPETAALMLELMNYQAYNELMPVFYQNFLNTKMVRDEESVEMLKIIHDSIEVDRMTIFIYGMAGTLSEYAKTGKTDYASRIAKQIKSVDKTIGKIQEQLANG